jgi:malate permease and related proteins
VTAVALAIAVSVAVGVGAERRWGARAQWAARLSLDLLLYLLVPFIAFFSIARLELTAGVGAGLAFAYVELAVVGCVAYVVGSRLLHLSGPRTGALICVTILANTGYLGLPLTTALLGKDDLGPAVAYDAVVTQPMLLVAGFGVGAVFGERAGTGARERLRSFVVRNPPLLAVLAGLVAPDALAPDALVDLSRTLVVLLLPVGFFALGVNLMQESEHGVLRFPPPVTAPLAVALGLRLVVAPALLAALSITVGGVPPAYLVQAGMPCGINSLVVAHAYGLDLDLVAGAIAWSTAIVVVGALGVAAFGGSV